MIVFLYCFLLAAASSPSRINDDSCEIREFVAETSAFLSGWQQALRELQGGQPVNLSQFKGFPDPDVFAGTDANELVDDLTTLGSVVDAALYMRDSSVGSRQNAKDKQNVSPNKVLEESDSASSNPGPSSDGQHSDVDSGVMKSPPPKSLELPRAVIPETTITPDHLFGKSWHNLPEWYIEDLNKKLPYLRECGVNQEIVREHFAKNWTRIKRDVLKLDTGFDVGSCHVQALTNLMLLAQYSDVSPEKIPFPVAFYFSACLMLSDHSEVRYADGTVGYLHSPEHATTILDPDSFPFRCYVNQKTKKSKNTKPDAFFPRIRQIAAMQALLLTGETKLPTIEPRVVTGVSIPRVPYPESFDLLFNSMKTQVIPFCVEVTSLSLPKKDGALKLFSGHAFGAYPNKTSLSGHIAPDTLMIVLQLYVVGLPEEEKNMPELLGQLKNFSILERVVTEVVFRAHEQSIPVTKRERFRAIVDAFDSDSQLESGWLQEVLGSRGTIFNKKFSERHVLELFANGVSGIAPRHVYCTTPKQLKQELDTRPAMVETAIKKKAEHQQRLKERADRRKQQHIEEE